MSRAPSRRVTSSDVAKKAGVSRATVSYVVNDVHDVRLTADTRERVLLAAAELGYSQYGPGRTLKSGRSDVVLLVLTDLPVGHALNTLLDELEAKLAENGLSLVIYRVGSRGNPVSRIWREIGPCAVVVMGAIADDGATEMRAAGIDVIRLNLGQDEGPGVLSQSQLDVGEMQVRYLVDRGHRNLGFAYPDDPRVESFALPRLEGARSACRELGLPDLDVRTVPMDASAAATAVRPWTRLPRPISAICAYNDNVAFAVLAGLRENQVAVPADISVIGVDNDPTGALFNPSLTTIDTRHLDVADELAHLVIAARRRDAPVIRAVTQRYSVVARDSA